jgi:hypothetical protein
MSHSEIEDIEMKGLRRIRSIGFAQVLIQLVTCGTVYAQTQIDTQAQTVKVDVSAACDLLPENSQNLIWVGNSIDYKQPPQSAVPAEKRVYEGVAQSSLPKSTNKWLIFFYSSKVDHLEFAEGVRHTRLYNDVSSLLQNRIQAGAAHDQKCGYHSQAVEVLYPHATITVQAYDKAATDSTKQVVQTVTIVYGPKEHAFLSLDLPVNSRKTLKYDSSSNSLMPQDTNPQFLISLNTMPFGDLASPDPIEWNTIYKGITGKVLLSASSRPLDSYGVGVGMKLPNIGALGVNLNAFSIFGAYMWSKQDSLSANGTPQQNGATSRGWRIGISYDLGTALKWAFGGSGSGTKTTKVSPPPTPTPTPTPTP